MTDHCSFSQLKRPKSDMSKDVLAGGFKTISDLSSDTNIKIFRKKVGKKFVKALNLARLDIFLEKEGFMPIDKDSYNAYKKDLAPKKHIAFLNAISTILFLATMLTICFSVAFAPSPRNADIYDCWLVLVSVLVIVSISFYTMFLAAKIARKAILLKSRMLRVIAFDDRIDNGKTTVPEVFRKIAQQIRQNFNDISLYVYQHTDIPRKTILSEFLVARYQGEDIYISAWDRTTGKIV